MLSLLAAVLVLPTGWLGLPFVLSGGGMVLGLRGRGGAIVVLFLASYYAAVAVRKL